jgi:hypothetical protein
MLGSQEYLARATQMERRAAEATSPELRTDYLKAAEGWRDLARRAQEIEARERKGGV